MPSYNGEYMQTRESMINFLINDWLDTLHSEPRQIETILRKGWAGYENMSDLDLEREFNNSVDGFEKEWD